MSNMLKCKKTALRPLSQNKRRLEDHHRRVVHHPRKRFNLFSIAVLLLALLRGSLTTVTSFSFCVSLTSRSSQPKHTTPPISLSSFVSPLTKSSSSSCSALYVSLSPPSSSTTKRNRRGRRKRTPDNDDDKDDRSDEYDVSSSSSSSPPTSGSLPLDSLHDDDPNDPCFEESTSPWDEGQGGFYDLTTNSDLDEDSDSVGFQQQQQSALDSLSFSTTSELLMGMDEDDFTASSSAATTSDFVRDEADILEEREDRFYVRQEQLERCLLVGVEDLSQRRNYNKRRKQQQLALWQQSQTQHGTVVAMDDNAMTAEDDNDDVEYLFSLEESLCEMRELIRTAGMEIADELTQRLPEINPRTYINSGKVEEAKELLRDLPGCSTIVFDAELTPGQQKTLENAFNEKIIQNDFRATGGEIKVIDRTALILDIFAQHAKTREGKLQVDLALHEYRKPRLTRMWTHLERQSGAGGASGSVGLRGPGESQLQIDKRLVRDRIITLKRRLEAVQEQRAVRRQGRDRLGLPVLSLVGYTNSGKSTLLNYLTKAGVMAESMLFATLDPTTRKVKLPGLKTHPEVLLTDTVGFIQKLPTQLVAAFRATLEEVLEADVLVHVIDVSNPSWRKQERAVRTVLSDIGAADKPVVRVFNKMDLLDAADAEYLRYEATVSKHTVAVSALYGEGVADLVACIEDAMVELLVPIEVVIPYSQGVELNAVHEQGNVELVDYRENGTYVRALVPESIANRLDQYRVTKPNRQVESAKEKKNENENDDVDWVALGRGRH